MPVIARYSLPPTRSSADTVLMVTGLTTYWLMVSVADEKELVVPVPNTVTAPSGAPPDWSHARNVRALATVPSSPLAGTK